MKKEYTLYNMIFPLWSLYLIPLAWVVILPANFIIDSIVFIAALAVLKVPDKKQKYKACILSVWGYGFLADLIGAVVLVFLSFGGADFQYDPLRSPSAFMITSIGVAAAAVCIYQFNYNKVLPRTGLEAGMQRKMALAIAILTAPYTMYIPTPF